MVRHHHIVLWSGLLLLIANPVLSQRKPAVKNVGIEIQQNNAIINYEIKSRKRGSNHLVFLNFIDERFDLVTPTTVTGDIGPGISSGTRNSIEWDITKDIDQLNSKITPVIFVDGVSKQFNNTGGPRNALLSIIMPGLGDYFVADQRMMAFKPYLRTISSLGLIGLGIYAGNQRYHAEGYYRTVATIQYGRWPSAPQPIYKEIYMEGDLRYWLFKGDKEVLISLGAAIWLADVLWVFARGINNERFMKSSTQGSDFKLGYQQGNITLNYAYRF